MTDERANPFSAEGWLDVQRKYWDAWSVLTRPAGKPNDDGPQPAGPAWADATQQWWRSLAPAGPPQIQDLYARMVEQGMNFLRAGEDRTALFDGLASGARSAQEWQRATMARFEEMRAALAGDSPGTPGAAPTWMAQWQAPFDSWLRTAGGRTPGGMPPDGGAGFTKALDAGYEQVERMLGFPGLGFTREWQEQTQELVRRALDCQRALAAYAQVFARLGTAAMDGLQQRVLAAGKEGDAISSLRELYDLWVDAAEQAYVELVRTEEYSRSYGHLVNSMMAYKQQGRRMLDDALDAVGMPTTRGLNTIQRRQHDLAREVARLRRRLDGSDAESLRRELEALRAEVRMLNRQSGTAKKRTGRRRPNGAKETK